MSSLVSQADELCQDGMSKSDLERILAWLAPHQPEVQSGRTDHPTMLVGETAICGRASITLALAAAAPNQRKRSLEILDRDILSRSTKPSQDSRVRTFLAVCSAWEIVPFPLTPECVRCVGASLKAGGYRSSHLYFQAAINHQMRRHGMAVEPFLRSLIKDVNRSVKRGLGPSKLKVGFNVHALVGIVDPEDEAPFSFERVAHVADLLLLCSWFMLRELEVSSARDTYLTLEGNEVSMMIPIHKTSIQSSLTTRTLVCACGVRLTLLCPWHAAERHLVRLHAHQCRRPSSYFPLFPGADGSSISKHRMNLHIRAALQAAGITTTAIDASGHTHTRSLVAIACVSVELSS